MISEEDSEGGKIPGGLPVVCLICLDLVRDNLRSDWAKYQRAAQSRD